MKLALKCLKINISPDNRENTVLITSKDLIESIRMLQGLCNALSAFQRAMDLILWDLKSSYVLFSLKDITVFSDTFTNHLKHFNYFFLKLLEDGLKLRSKVLLFQNYLKLLGNEATTTVICSINKRLEAIEKISAPLKFHKRQGFLWMRGFCLHLIKDFKLLSEPLRVPPLWFLLQRKQDHQ